MIRELTPASWRRGLSAVALAAAALAPGAAASAAGRVDDGLNLTRQDAAAHTTRPGAQWYPEAGLGLFVHWGIATVEGLNISWPMIDGVDGRPAQITPNEYFALARSFNPQNFHPDRWLKAAKDAGFVYAVLTTRHHEGFALWPSAYGDFDTKKFMGGRDLVREFVEACRRNGLKVGLYYSPPDWEFERAYKNFEFDRNKPPLDADLHPRRTRPAPEELARHYAAYSRLIRGQIEELLTHYGKIDVLWFDGRPPMLRKTDDALVSLEQIRAWQPDVVINPRFHGRGDFVTYERTLPPGGVATTWAEYCNTWTDYWGYVAGARYRAPAFVLGQYAVCRSRRINYLLSLGPRADGELEPAAYANLAILASWMAKNGASVRGTMPLPPGETASVPATAAGRVRFLFAIPRFRDAGNPYPENQIASVDEILTLSVAAPPRSVTLLATGARLEYRMEGNILKVSLPASVRTRLVDVVRVGL
ncbi:MAG TPA: alpha-L-fucosidase [Opitutaceae bacterium]|nr:alpha-L-fucosidase [Opitutaceae bacterium]